MGAESRSMYVSSGNPERNVCRPIAKIRMCIRFETLAMPLKHSKNWKSRPHSSRVSHVSKRTCMLLGRGAEQELQSSHESEDFKTQATAMKTC